MSPIQLPIRSAAANIGLARASSRSAPTGRNRFSSLAQSSIARSADAGALRKLGVESEMLGEVLAIAGLFNQTNALAKGYQIEPDVLPPLE
jgi:hypothetical protein